MYAYKEDEKENEMVWEGKKNKQFLLKSIAERGGGQRAVCVLAE